MVCEKCQIKLGRVITPDPWKSGARNTTESGGRLINENKALTSKKNRFNPYSTFEKCRICKSTVHQSGSHYCQAPYIKWLNALSGAISIKKFTVAPYVSVAMCLVYACAYKKGICAMCGKKVIDTKNYRQSSV